jgi:hypothetical protein
MLIIGNCLIRSPDHGFTVGSQMVVRARVKSRKYAAKRIEAGLRQDPVHNYLVLRSNENMSVGNGRNYDFTADRGHGRNS